MAAPGSPIRYRRSAHVLWRQAAGVVVLARADEPESPPLALTGPAPVLWLALDAPATLDALTEVMVDIYDADDDTVRAELSALLDSLGSQGYVETVS